MTTKDLIDLSKLTNGRISDRTVFIDFVSLCAMAISCAVDCVHADARRKGIAEILTRYQLKERSQLFTGLRDLTDAVKTDIEQQRWEDRLNKRCGGAAQRCRPSTERSHYGLSHDGYYPSAAYSAATLWEGIL